MRLGYLILRIFYDSALIISGIILRGKSNISFLISSYLNYGGTLNSLVAYSAY